MLAETEGPAKARKKSHASGVMRGCAPAAGLKTGLPILPDVTECEVRSSLNELLKQVRETTRMTDNAQDLDPVETREWLDAVEDVTSARVHRDDQLCHRRGAGDEALGRI